MPYLRKKKYTTCFQWPVYRSFNFIERLYATNVQGPVVRKLINVNTRLKIKLGFHLAY